VLQVSPKSQDLEALAFLEKLRPGGPWVLTAIVPDGTTETITARTPDRVEAFIREHDGTRNLYYSVNPTRRAMSKKTAKTDIAAIEYALADLDPAEGETPAAAKARYFKQLEGAFEPKPSAGIDSGNGIQCLWRLKERIVLGEPIWVEKQVTEKGRTKTKRVLEFSAEDQAKIDDVEARIAAVMLRLGGKTGTQNIDRILRLPGTTNLPNATKRKKGRVACPTELLWFDNTVHLLSAFPIPKQAEGDGEKLSPAQYQELLELGTINGVVPEHPGAACHKLIWHLASQGKNLDEITALLRQHPNGIAAKFLKPIDRLDKEAKRSFKKYIATNPPVIVKWNQNHAHVLAGGKSAVLQEFKTPEGYTDFKLLSSASFHEWNIEHKITISKKGELEVIPVTRFWMQHPGRRKYQDIGFFPGRDVPGFYNLWRGFAVAPRKGDCSKFLAHLYENVCQDDDDLYAWVVAWLADIFQRPAVKCGTSLALRGKQGVGKTKIGEVLETLLGVHYKLVADPRYVTGRFNSHMISLLMLHADEGFWAGDKKAEGKLKDLVTGNRHPIEFKGKEAFWINNYARLFVTGNQDWQVPAGFEERRFAVLDVGDAHQQDHAYFAAIDAEMNAGGREALLHHLLFEVDCSKINLRQIPHTMALVEQKLETASPEHGWWLDILRRGTLPGYRDETPQNEVSSEVLYVDYIEHAKKQGVPRRAIETQLGIFLQKVVGSGLHRSKKTHVVENYTGGVTSEKRGLVYVFPPLSECRQVFAALLNEEITWEWEGDDWS
jgi:hypothetical protein